MRRPGMGVRLSDFTPTTLRYRRVRSSKRFIRLMDGITKMSFYYEVFGFTGYGCAKVVHIDREAESLLERFGDRLCWNSR